ncbi:MAG: hypothetical protein JWP27_1872 [Flaviaesturariibacter sp.]|nr:hypothetical protein [Flaviaesturariibacter sp.]
MKHEVLQLIDILGTISFALSGVFAAMQRRLDIFGILIIAFITAVGGGTLRDLLIGNLPVTWMRGTDYSLIILVTAVAGIAFHKTIRHYRRTLVVFDSLGLGFVTILGLQKGIAFGLHPGICIALGTITGCFGGVIRDISLNTIPLIFQKEIYATACIIGGCVYFGLQMTGLGRDWLDVASIAAIFLVRLAVIYYKLALPDIYPKNDGVTV